jgi:hypothetical protein
MRDFLNRELNKDDIVIIRTPDYSSICLARVIAFTPMKVRLEYFNTWNYGKPVRFTTLQHPSVVAKVDEDAAAVHRAQYGQQFTDAAT